MQAIQFKAQKLVSYLEVSLSLSTRVIPRIDPYSFVNPYEHLYPEITLSRRRR